MNLGVDLKKRLGGFSFVINRGALVFLKRFSGKLGFLLLFTFVFTFTLLFTFVFTFTLLFITVFTFMFILLFTFVFITVFTFTCVFTTLFLPTRMGSRIPIVVRRLPIRSFNWSLLNPLIFLMSTFRAIRSRSFRKTEDEKRVS